MVLAHRYGVPIRGNRGETNWGAGPVIAVGDGGDRPSLYPDHAAGGDMISVAISRCGIVLWHETGEWRVYGVTDARRRSLSWRVRSALSEIDAGSRVETRRALLSIGRASLLVDNEITSCDDECDGRCAGDGREDN